MNEASPQTATSPCTGICKMDAAGLCLSCRRSMQEIVAWGQMSESERRHIINTLLPPRRASKR